MKGISFTQKVYAYVILGTNLLCVKTAQEWRENMVIHPKARILSITINNEYIKISEISRLGKVITVHKAVTIATPERSYSDGIIKDRTSLAKTIKVALDDNRITTTNVIFSITSTKIATKEVILPNVKQNKIGEIITTNASEYFPVNIEQYVIQHFVLERLTNDENKIKVQVMAAPSEMIETYYDFASSMGFYVVAIDYVGNSTYQALKRQIDSVPSVVIQVENDSTIVNIFNNNILQFQKIIPYGKSVLVNAIMDSYSVKYDVALTKLQSENLLHTNFDGDPVTESMRYLIGNVNRIIDYFINRNSAKPVEKAYLIGNATTITGFADLFQNELNLPVICIDQLKDVICDKKTYLDISTLPNYITNIGAFIEPVNFVPRNLTENSKENDNTQIIKGALTASIVISALLIFVPFFMMISAKSNRDSLQKNVDRIKNIEDVVKDYYDSKDMASDAMAFRSLSVNNDDALAGFITSLESQMPSDISIKNMNITNGNVTITGGAGSKSSIALFIQRLSAVNNVAGVKIGSETETKDNSGIVTINFSLSCTFINTDSGINGNTTK